MTSSQTLLTQKDFLRWSDRRAVASSLFSTRSNMAEGSQLRYADVCSNMEVMDIGTDEK